MQNKILLEAYIPLQISKKHILGRHEAVTECRKGALSLDIIIHTWAAIGQRPNPANMSYADETKDILESNVSLKVLAFELCDEVQYFPCCDYFSLKLTKNIC